MYYFSIFLTILWFSVSAFAFSGINLVPNGGFERDLDANTIPDSWFVEGSSSAIYKIESHCKKGRCVSILGRGVYACRLKGLKKNKSYLLSLWIKRDGWREGEYPKIRIFGQEFYLNNIIGWGDWIRLFLLVNSGNNNNTTLQLINPGLHHKIYFDEILLKEFSPVPVSPKGEIYTYWPEFVWCMPENPYVLQIQVEISRYADFRDPFIITYGINPRGNRLYPSFPIDGGRWFWRIKVYKNRKLIATSNPASFYISAYFPIGIYGVPLKYLDVIREAGFNSICLGGDHVSIKKSYSLALKKGLNLLLGVPSDLNNKDSQDLIIGFRNQAGILGWYLRDEPEIWLFPPAHLWELKRYIKSLDPTHPSLITLVRAKKAEDYGECADIIMVDPYPIPRRPVTWLSDSIDKVKRLFPYKPVWAVIQAFDWSAFPYGEEKRDWGRDPTYEEERCLTYLAIIHGARGLFYYTFKSKNYFIMERKKHWHEVKKVIKELNNIYPIIVSPTIFPAEDVAYSKDKAIHYIIKGLKHKLYLFCVNVTPHFKDAILQLPDICLNGKAKEIFQKSTLSIKKGLLKTSFSPYQVQIYEISPLTRKHRN